MTATDNALVESFLSPLGSWRERDHDDLVLATALATWAAETMDVFKPPRPPIRPLRYLILIVGGILGALYFFSMDTSVSLGYGEGRVHNIGLMLRQQMGVILSVAGSALGGGLLILDAMNKNRRDDDDY
jgi:hypothetical protein